jgi:hypothetical protein
MNLSFSLALNSLFPHIEQNGIGLKTPISNFGRQMPFSSHNCMARPSLGLDKTSVGNALYCITSHLIKTNAFAYDSQGCLNHCSNIL